MSTFQRDQWTYDPCLTEKNCSSCGDGIDVQSGWLRADWLVLCCDCYAHEHAPGHFIGKAP